MPPLVIHLLGPPTVEWQGAYLPIPRRRVRALLFRLALELQPVAREHLVFLFWANQPNELAHRDLTHLLTHLRRALPQPEIVQTTADFIFLDPRRTWCDAHEFVQLFRCAQFNATPALLSQGAALVRGGLMDGFALDDCPEFEEWLTLERSVWERRHLALLRALQTGAQAEGNLPLTIAAAQAVLALDAMDPDTHRRLVQARLAAGEADLVRRQWEAIRDLVQDYTVG